jgi:hypothetical protein
MVARLKQVGDEYLLSLPPEAVRQLAPGGAREQVEVEVAIENGQVVLRPFAEADTEEVRRIAKQVMNDYDSALRRLAE